MGITYEDDAPKITYEERRAPAEKSMLDKVDPKLLMAGPAGVIGAGFKLGLDSMNDIITKGAYKAGGEVTDLGTKAGLSPEVAAGAGMAANVGIQAVPALIGGAGGRALAPVVGDAAKSLMQSSLKPILGELKKGNGERAVTTMLDEGLLASKGGVKKLNGMLDDLSGKMTDVLQKYSGATVDKGAVASRIQDVVKRIETSNPTPQSAFAEVNKVYDDFLTNGLIPKNIPIQAANEFKSGIYRILREKYGTLGTEHVEAQKALGRGFKEEINAAAPEVVPLNARMGELANARNILERRTMVEGNTNIGGLAALTHSPGAAAAFLLDKYGMSKSLLAQILWKGRQAIPEATGAGIGAGVGGILSKVNQEQQ